MLSEIQKSSFRSAIGPLFLLLGLVFLLQLDEKENLFELLGLYFISFWGYLVMVRHRHAYSTNLFWFVLALAWIIPLLELPYLSNDYFRFLWDGELLHLGINPFDFTPKEFLIIHPELVNCEMLDLFAGMGELSQRNYSVYPSFNQLLFFLGTGWTASLEWSVFIFRLEFMVAILLIVYFGIACLKLLNLDETRIYLVVFNPLVIIESIGNLHFELVMIAFVLMSSYFLLKGNWMIAAIALALAVQIKLIPLILFPFLLRYLGWKKTIGFGVILFGLILTSTALIIDGENIAHFGQSLQLYFRSFEFNSFLLYPYIQWGKLIYGWNRTKTYAPMLANWAFYIILAIAFYGGEFSKEKLFRRVFYGLCVYFLFTSTLHPWYWIFPLCLTLFKVNFAVVLMTGVTFLSYGIYTYGHHSAYNHMLSVINILVLGIFVLEYVKPNLFLKHLRLNPTI